MNRIVNSLFTVSVICLLTACKKDPLPKPVDAKLSVKLEQAYVDISEVDSAIAIWKMGDKQVQAKLEVDGDDLKANIKDWNEGAGTLTVRVYGKNDYPGAYRGIWELRESMTMKKSVSVEVSGPQSFSDSKWKPRIVLKDGIGHEAIVALRPDDPYFLLKDVSHATHKIVVERAYWKTIQGVMMTANKVWNCTSNCTGAADEEYFKSLPTQIGTKPWNHVSITILYQTSVNGEGWVLNFEHDI